MSYFHVKASISSCQQFFNVLVLCPLLRQESHDEPTLFSNLIPILSNILLCLFISSIKILNTVLMEHTDVEMKEAILFWSLHIVIFCRYQPGVNQLLRADQINWWSTTWVSKFPSHQRVTIVAIFLLLLESHSNCQIYYYKRAPKLMLYQ